MDFDFRCNRLSCRKSLTDKAVVTTCSHIFCVDCANELFSASRLCPACESALTEPDDVVVSSLHPSNDYKTSVLSGLNPATILEICSRAISFWQYQIHQENSFQHAVVRSINDKNAQLQKQLENLVREADSEINLLSSKLSGDALTSSVDYSDGLGNLYTDVERELDMERRKNRDLQETSRERDKEYQKLKAQYDKLKRRALLAPAVGAGQPGINLAAGAELPSVVNSIDVSGLSKFGKPINPSLWAKQMQRPPIVSRGVGQFSTPAGPSLWNHGVQQHTAPPQTAPPVRQPFVASDRSFRLSASERSNSAQEVEELLGSQGRVQRKASHQGGWGNANHAQQQRSFVPMSGRRTSGVFRPGGKNK